MKKYNLPPIELKVTLKNIDEVTTLAYKLFEIDVITVEELGIITLQLLNKRVDLISLQTT
jgi:hypothetical protein